MVTTKGTKTGVYNLSRIQFKTYQQGYSQHKTAKVSGLNKANSVEDYLRG